MDSFYCLEAPLGFLLISWIQGHLGLLGVPRHKLRIMDMTFNINVNADEKRGWVEPGLKGKQQLTNALSFFARHGFGTVFMG